MRDCPICFEKKKNIISGYCNHEFCKECIKRWNKPTCPLCRQKLYAGPELPNTDKTININIEFLHIFTPESHIFLHYIVLPNNIIGNVIERNIDRL